MQFRMMENNNLINTLLWQNAISQLFLYTIFSLHQTHTNYRSLSPSLSLSLSLCSTNAHTLFFHLPIWPNVKICCWKGDLIKGFHTNTISLSLSLTYTHTYKLKHTNTHHPFHRYDNCIPFVFPFHISMNTYLSYGQAINLSYSHSNEWEKSKEKVTFPQ